MGVESILAPFMRQAEICSLGDRMRDRSRGCWSAGNAKVPVITVRRPPFGTPGRSAVPVSAALLNPQSSGHTRSVADLAVSGLPLRGASPAPCRSASGSVSRTAELPR